MFVTNYHCVAAAGSMHDRKTTWYVATVISRRPSVIIYLLHVQLIVITVISLGLPCGFSTIFDANMTELGHAERQWLLSDLSSYMYPHFVFVTSPNYRLVCDRKWKSGVLQKSSLLWNGSNFEKIVSCVMWLATVRIEGELVDQNMDYSICRVHVVALLSQYNYWWTNGLKWLWTNLCFHVHIRPCYLLPANIKTWRIDIFWCSCLPVQDSHQWSAQLGSQAYWTAWHHLLKIR